MQREMTDPSEAMPVIVREFIRPMMDELEAIVARLAPGLDADAVTRSRDEHRGTGAVLPVRDAGRAARPGRARATRRELAAAVAEHITAIQPGRPRRRRTAAASDGGRRAR